MAICEAITTRTVYELSNMVTLVSAINERVRDQLATLASKIS